LRPHAIEEPVSRLRTVGTVERISLGHEHTGLGTFIAADWLLGGDRLCRRSITGKQGNGRHDDQADEYHPSHNMPALLSFNKNPNGRDYRIISDQENILVDRSLEK